MPPDYSTPGDPGEFLTSQRLGTAISALADPGQNTARSAADLDEGERDAVRQALSRSSQPLAGFARDLLDQWEDLADDDRVAGLLLFAQLTRNPERGMGR